VVGIDVDQGIFPDLPVTMTSNRVSGHHPNEVILQRPVYSLSRLWPRRSGATSRVDPNAGSMAADKTGPTVTSGLVNTLDTDADRIRSRPGSG
jgi:hypothetical protein